MAQHMSMPPEALQPQDMADCPDTAMSQGNHDPQQKDKNTSSERSDCEESSVDLSKDCTAGDEFSEDDDLSDVDMDDVETKFYTAPTVELDRENLNALMTAASVTAFLSPGTAFFLGKKRIYGAIVNLAVTVFVLIISVLAVLIDFFPVPLYVALFVLVIICWGIGFFHTFNCRLPNVRPAEPWIQVSLAVLTFWFPFACAFYLVSGFVLQRTWMSNDTMKPGMMRGDLILVDKHAFTSRDPDYGDLVLIEEKFNDNEIIRKRAFFGRVIAKPQDRVQLYGVQPAVNGVSLTQLHRQTENGIYDRNILTYELPYGTALSENLEEPDKWYPVYAPNQLLFSQTNIITLEDDYYFVLEDNREVKRDRVRSSYGSIVHRSEVKGQPRYIIYNTQSRKPFERYGLHLR